MLLSIILPCYNPLLGWEKNVYHRFQAIVGEYPQDHFELIVVNDGSQIDDTVVDFLKIKIPQFSYINLEKNKGKGHALRTGLSVAQGELYLLVDIDFPYINQNIFDIISLLKQNKDLVWVTRDKSYYSALPVARKVISFGLQMLMKLLLRMPYTDTQGGLKGLNKKGANLFLKTSINRYLFDVELIKMAYQQNLNICTIQGKLSEGVHLPNVSMKILFKEFSNFIKIIRS